MRHYLPYGDLEKGSKQTSFVFADASSSEWYEALGDKYSACQTRNHLLTIGPAAFQKLVQTVMRSACQHLEIKLLEIVLMDWVQHPSLPVEKVLAIIKVPVMRRVTTNLKQED